MQYQFSGDRPVVIKFHKSELPLATFPADLYVRVKDEKKAEVPISKLINNPFCVRKEEGDSVSISFPNDRSFCKALQEAMDD